MKSVLIVILGAALAAGLFLSRPDQATFAAYLAQNAGQSEPNFVARLFKKGSSENNAKSYDFHDGYFWSSADRNGKTIYIGLFSRWFKIGAPT